VDKPKKYVVTAVMSKDSVIAYSSDELDHYIASVVQDCFKLGAISVVIRDTENNRGDYESYSRG